MCAHPGHVPVRQRDGSFLRRELEGVPDGSMDLEHPGKTGSQRAEVSVEGQRASSLLVLTVHLTEISGLALPKTYRWVRWAKMAFSVAVF